jgi:hypothetical protein
MLENLDIRFNIIQNENKGERNDEKKDKKHDYREINEKHKLNLYRKTLNEILLVLINHVNQYKFEFIMHHKLLLNNFKHSLHELNAKFSILYITNNVSGFFTYVQNYFTFIIHQSICVGMGLNDGVYNSFNYKDKKL